MEQEKVCNQCSRVLPITAFYRKKSDGRYLARCKECIQAYNKIWHAKNPLRYKAIRKKWQDANRDQHNANSRAWHANNRERSLENKIRWHKDNKEYRKAFAAHVNRHLRYAALVAYSQDPPSCRCCGKMNLEFLSLDHIEGNGRAHRGHGSSSFYRKLQRENYPNGLRVLCHNCNMSLGIYGYCPHVYKSEKAPKPFIPKNTSPSRI